MPELTLLGICLPEINEALLPECPEEGGPYYDSELDKQMDGEEISPPYHLFSIESEELNLLTGEDNEEMRKFVIILNVLSEYNKICDKTSMLYMTKIFQYECLGGPLSSDMEEVFEGLHDSMSVMFKLAEDTAKRFCDLYLIQ